MNIRSIYCVVFFLGIVASNCFAGSGNSIKLPTQLNMKVKNGIIADLDTRWTDGWGYRPIRIKLSLRKSKRDRTIRIDLKPESQYQSNGMGIHDPLTITTEVEIPQGEKVVKKTVYVPQQLPWSQIRAEFFEDGKKLKDLSMPYSIGIGGNYNNHSPCVLLVDKDAPKLDADRDAISKKMKKSQKLPDAEKFQFLGSNNYYAQRKINTDFFKETGRAMDDDSLDALKVMGNVEMLPPDELPEKPLGLAGIDIIIFSLDELTELSQSDPARFKAIDYFVRNGGNLIAFGESGSSQRVSELFRREHEWLPANTSLFPESPEESFDEMAVGGTGADDFAIDRKRRKDVIPKNAPKFVSTEHGLGRIVAIDSADPYDQAVAYWQWVLHQIGVDRLTWPERHGVTLTGKNDDYWDFMIPGFGASPVEGFLGVISLFILMIGPLNFYLLKKFKRLYLLPLTVVAAAMVTIVTMMCYAVFSDGVTTRVRLRSFTLIDQTDDEHIAMTRCRHSYLAAITPSKGLVFPDRLGVYPLVPFYSGTDERGEILKERSNERVLSKGYLRSRTTTQFLTTDVNTVECGIEPTSTGKQNNMGVVLTHVWYCDEDGNAFFAENVEPGATIDFQPVVKKDAMIAMNKLMADNRPTPPPGLDKTNNNSMFSMGFGRGWNRFYQPRAVYSTTSLMHENMKYLSRFFKEAKPNSYLAVSEMAPPFVHMGTSAEQIAGFHVMKGDCK